MLPGVRWQAQRRQGKLYRVTLTHTQAKRYYDWFGRKQDSQGFYEDAALQALIDHAEFGRARHLFELGCGTGRFAERLFRELLDKEANYIGLDLSRTMTSLASLRLADFAGRARIVRARGDIAFPLADRVVDRIISSYVLDLLSEQAIRRVLDESHRVLQPGGRVCLAGLTTGVSLTSRLVSSLWNGIFHLSASIVGGCRPLQLLAYLDTDKWEIGYHQVIVQFGVPSEVVIAYPRL